MAQEFIEFFTKTGQTVLDPMVGTGSTLVACLRSGRNGFGIELNPDYAAMARTLIADEQEAPGVRESIATVIEGDATELLNFDLPEIDYVITSPPYWDMLHARGAKTQKQRRSDGGLDVTYSEHPADLGNIRDYPTFLSALIGIYGSLTQVLRPRAYMTIIVKNIKKGGEIYPLAWDLARELREIFTLKDEKIWAQDNIRLAPYGMGNAWVSNTFHHYCLQFRYEPE